MTIKNKITNMFASLVIMTFAIITNVQADTSKFTGFGAGVSAGYSGGDLDWSDSTGSINLGDNSTVLGFDVNYSMPVDGNFFVGIGATYDFNDTDIGSLKIGADSISFTADDHYSAYIQPSYAVSPNTAVFGKLGYHEIEGKVTVAGSTYGVSATEDFKGWGYGAGIKTILSNNFYIQAEVGIVEYDKETDAGVSFEPTVVSGIVTVGYKY
jgi:opacity protein-like surface antigen